MIPANTIVGGRYRVVKPLGGGGMKLVYLAEDLRLAARPCALAEMVDGFTDPEAQRRAVTAFQREADMLAQLGNEHIPRIFDRFSDQNRHYLVMEYVSGTTLEEILRERGGRLGEAEVVDIAIQILETLDYLHNLSPPVIYRDLKPSNVMLSASGQVKLIDFGIARHFQPQSNATMIGTQGYAPPEQYRGQVEARSDLYALGATMHYALSGRDPALEPPFSFPALRSLCPAADPELAELIDQALQYDVSRRVPDAAEFKRRLISIKRRIDFSAAPTGLQPTSEEPDRDIKAGRWPAAPGVVMPPSSAPPAATPDRATGMECPKCRSIIPADSRFCSFCATDLRLVLGASDSAAEAETSVLAAPAELPQAPSGAEASGPHQPSHHWRLGFYALVLASMFFGAFLLTWLARYIATSTVEVRVNSGRGSYPPAVRTPPGGYSSLEPDTPDPPHRTARARILRQALDQQGYGTVHFQIIGDTIVLWGTVPTETDRVMVQTMVFTVAQIFSLEDHILVRNRFAGP